MATGWISKRMARTSAPVVVELAKLVRESKRQDVLSLAQGVVHWGPPDTALERAKQALALPATSRYGPDQGLQDLRDRLAQQSFFARKPVKSSSTIMVTQGANQAIFSSLLCCTDVKDSVGLLVPYYFNHHMALTALDLRVHLVQRDELTMQCCESKVEQAIVRGKLKALILTNPCNPTGTLIPLAKLQKIQRVAQKHRCTLIVDNTYRDFVFGQQQQQQQQHELVFGPNVYNVFSLSKNYGMAGWRIGYVDCPSEQAFDSMLKVQDTVVICPTIISQHAALGALESGDAWVSQRVQQLGEGNLLVVRAALEKCSAVERVCGGQGSIFLFAKLRGVEVAAKPAVEAEKTKNDGDDDEVVEIDEEEGGEVMVDDTFVVRQLVDRFGVAVLPGSACGMPGWLRVSFANLAPAECALASERLEQGLNTLYGEFKS